MPVYIGYYIHWFARDGSDLRGRAGIHVVRPRKRQNVIILSSHRTYVPTRRISWPGKKAETRLVIYTEKPVR